MGDLERFMSKVERDPISGCLLWVTGKRSQRQEYGAFKTRDGKNWPAHRWIFLQKYGYLPPVVRHRCDTPPRASTGSVASFPAPIGTTSPTESHEDVPPLASATARPS